MHGVPATKCRSPESRTVPQPLGESRASWSKVRILPPALRMRLRARLLTRSAHTCRTWGTNVVKAPLHIPQELGELPELTTAVFTTSRTRGHYT